MGQIEISTEANPGASSSFDGLREAGFNRLSLGVQSFLDQDLIRLGRIHDSGQASEAVRLARQAGFDNLSLDLMFALPNQSLNAWKNNLLKCIELGPEHLSLYCLTIEEGTPFAKLYGQGKLTQPDEDAQVEMYDLCDEMLATIGLERYEISNFARLGRECEHNLCYWRGEEYLAYGPGAVGCVDVEHIPGNDPEGKRIRFTNVKSPNLFCKAMSEGRLPWQETESLDESTLKRERMMLGIRTREGVEISDYDAKRLEPLTVLDWATIADGRISLTPQGRHYCNDVAALLIVDC